jgi:hypothetical protein
VLGSSYELPCHEKGFRAEMGMIALHCDERFKRMALLCGWFEPPKRHDGYYGPGGFGELTGLPAAARIPRRERNKNTARRLWQISEQLTKVHFPKDHIE